MASNLNAPHREPWNKGKIVGQKTPFRIKDIWALRVRHRMESRVREPVRDHTGGARSCAEVDQAIRAEVRSFFLFPSRVHASPHLGTRQCARILEGWVEELGLDPAEYGTHSMRRTKATLIYRRTKNLRAVQLLLGHAKLESTVRYLGIEVDDALEISEQTEI